MKQLFLFGAALTILAAAESCKGKTSYDKTKSGLMYKIISDEKNPVVKKGEFLKVHFQQKVRDTVLMSSFTSLPEYIRVDSVGPEYSPLEVFTMLRKGDSLVVAQITDTLEKKGMGQLPPFMKKGDHLLLTLRVLDVFKDEAAVEADREKEAEAFKEGEVKVLQQFMASKKINAQPAGKGVFVEIEQQGTGAVADTGKTVSVMYTGTLLDGTKFDSNRDTAMNPTKQPLTFTVGQQQMIPGFEQGVKLLSKGAKAKIYIPSMMGYGRRPMPGGKGYDHLIFDVEVVDIK